MQTKSPPKKPHNAKQPELFYDAPGAGYWLKLNCGRFLCLDKTNALIHIRAAVPDFDPDEWIGALTAKERALYVAQVERTVDYAGPLAGHRAGPFMTASGARVLVTSAPRPEVFQKSEAKAHCPKLEKFLFELFGPEQLISVLGWLKMARASLLAGDFRPGQLVVLAGPSNCGKSLFQALVTELFGGRSGKPYRYMIGETSFNADLAAAEHLLIEDENASVDIRARRKFGAAIKEFTVCTELSVHAKGRQAVTLPTFKRLTLSVNHEPENLMILPPLDSSLMDKIMLFKCSPATLSEDRKENWDLLTNELPGFSAYLASIRIPKNLRCARFGIVAYHNTELLELLHAVNPEARLLALIDEVLQPKQYPWEGSAEQLERELRSSAFCFAVEKLLYFSSACGTYLARLALRFPNRFAPSKSKGKTTWRIGEP